MKFSFIIPAKNEENAIELCITSIRHQNFESSLIEIIVIDDYSSDNTAQVAKSLNATVLTPNLPLGKTSRAHNKNFVVQYSRGEYLIFLDAHIILPSEDWLSNVATVIKHNISENNLFLASFPAIPPPELTLLLNTFSREEVKTISLSVSQATKGLDQFVGGSMVISKEAFIKLGGFPIVPASEDIGLYRNAITNGIKYVFGFELWVWHLDKKLQSTKFWLKRNLKEGYFSTAYSWSNPNKFGKIYSFLLGIS